MLGWVFKPKTRASRAENKAPGPGAGTDLEFLRSRTDFDADEMASVHRTEAPSSRLTGGADPGCPDSSATARLPHPGHRVSGSARPNPVAATPYTGNTATPGELVLSVQVGERSSVVVVRDVALIGRYDESQDLTPEVDLSQDDAVSRRHARIIRRGGQYWIQDLDSTNGTRFNSAWLTPETECRLSNGDVIDLGESSSLRVLDISFGIELTDEDEQLSGLLNEALGVSLAVEETPWPLNPSVRDSLEDGVDLLEVALSRGAEAGLLPSDASDFLPPAPAPQWRVRKTGDIELPSFVEPYR